MSLSAVVDPPAILVLCSCPDEAVALDIARELVNQGLAACVSRVAPMMSIYRWQGGICEASRAAVADQDHRGTLRGIGNAA